MSINTFVSKELNEMKYRLYRGHIVLVHVCRAVNSFEKNLASKYQVCREAIDLSITMFLLGARARFTV